MTMASHPILNKFILPAYPTWPIIILQLTLGPFYLYMEEAVFTRSVTKTSYLQKLVFFF